MPIQVENVFISYFKKTTRQVDALKDICLRIEDGSFNAIIGETGSGKSTLIQTFNALLQPDKGVVKVDEFLISKKRVKEVKKLRKHVALVFQFSEYQLFEETILKDVMFGLKNYLKDDKLIEKKAIEALTLVGIDNSYYEKSPFELSGGEKRRVAIAGILALEPDILVLDEPLAGLDLEGTRMMINLLKDLNKKGKTIILVTHDMKVVLEVCEKVFVLDKGKFVYEGDPYLMFSHIKDIASLDVPELFLFVNKLINKGLSIDIHKIKNVDDLFNEIKGNKHE